jgi:hypothetical protein
MSLPETESGDPDGPTTSPAMSSKSSVRDPSSTAYVSTTVDATRSDFAGIASVTGDPNGVTVDGTNANVNVTVSRNTLIPTAKSCVVCPRSPPRKPVRSRSVMSRPPLPRPRARSSAG